MSSKIIPGALVRELSRLFVRSQRAQSACVDGASNVQCHVLTELLRVDDLTQQTLAERLSLDKAWISRAVDALVSDGVVAKRPHEQDKRSVKLSLTALGRIRAEKLEQTLNAHAAQVFEHIAQDKHEQIHDALALLIDALKQGDASQTEPQMVTQMSCDSGCAAEPAALQFDAASKEDVPAIETMLVAARLPIVGVRKHLPYFLVGKLQDQLVAVGGLEVYGEYALLRSICVNADYRGLAYGRQVVQQMGLLAQQTGVRDVYLKTVDAMPFFESLGFQRLSKDAVPDVVKQSSQFRGACAASATVMRKRL